MKYAILKRCNNRLVQEVVFFIMVPQIQDEVLTVAKNGNSNA